MISNFEYWIAKNKANDKHQYDGRTWTYNSVKAFEELFPYLTSSQIRRCLESLVEQGVLLKGDYNKNRYERTSWFAFLDESAFLYGQMDLSDLTNGDVLDDKSITDSKPNGKPNNNTGGDLNSSSPINQGTDNPDEMKKGGGSAAGFVKPTIDEVQAYAKVKHEMTDMAAKKFAEEFWNFYESKGWLVGKSKMKSWQSAVAGTWKEKAIKLKGGSGTIVSTTSNVKFNIQ